MVTRSLSDYSLVPDVCWYFVTYLCSSLLDYQVRTTRTEGHTRFVPFVPSKLCVVFWSADARFSITLHIFFPISNFCLEYAPV